MPLMLDSLADPTVKLAAGCEARCRGCTHRRLTAAASEAQKMDWLKRRLAPWAERVTAFTGSDRCRRVGATGAKRACRRFGVKQPGGNLACGGGMS